MSRSLAATPPPEGAIPEGWEVARVGDIFDAWGGATPSTSEKAYWGGSIPWISSKDVKTWRLTNGTDFVTKRAVAETRLRFCRPGTVLVVVRSGVLVHTLPVSIVEAELVINQDVKAFFCPERTLNEWLALFLRAGASQILAENRKDGTTVQSVDLEKLKALSLPVPPIAEQTRILAKVEELRARVNVARERLARMPAILRRFRQGVLRLACGGRLTAEWRSQQEAVGGWTTERAADVCAKVQSGGTPKEGFVEGPGIPFLKIYNIVDQQVNFAYRPQFVTKAVHSRPLGKSRTLPGDVLMNIVGPPLGKVAVVPDTYPEWNINQAITLFRPSGRITTGWLYLVLCSGVNVESVDPETRGSAGQSNISLSQCREFPLPVPGIAEQREIGSRVEALFKLADATEKRVAAATARADRLTQAILAKAFRGELVPTETELARREGRGYEPAATLLERVRAESAGADTKADRRRRRAVPESAPRRARAQVRRGA